MPSKVKIICSAPSNGAMAVVEELRARGVEASKLAGINPIKRNSLVVAWGTETPAADLNGATAITAARDKYTTFVALNPTVPVPPFYRIQADVQRDRRRDDIWLARTRGGTGGSGIRVVRPGETMPAAELYVKYVPKSREFRLHMFRTPAGVECIHIQEKKKRRGVDQDRDEKLIRSHDNGWVFAENGLEISEALRTNLVSTCTRALEALGLDFGAFDVILDKEGTNVFVLEVNTRPGVESTSTRQAYAGAIQSWLRREEPRTARRVGG